MPKKKSVLTYEVLEFLHYNIKIIIMEQALQLSIIFFQIVHQFISNMTINEKFTLFTNLIFCL